MNRTIKFRGKRCKDGEWVYGSYVESNTSWNGHKPHKSWILPSPMTNGGWFSIRGAYPVIDETVGQFTGLVDKNGKDIYENCELDGEYIVEYIAPSFVGRNKINNEIIKLYDNKFTITKEEYGEIS